MNELKEFIVNVKEKISTISKTKLDEVENKCIEIDNDLSILLDKISFLEFKEAHNDNA